MDRLNRILDYLASEDNPLTRERSNQIRRQKLKKEIRRQQQQDYNTYNPLFGEDEDEETKFRIAELAMKNRQEEFKEMTESLTINTVLKNKFFWFFFILLFLIAIFFIIVYTVPEIQHLMCDSITRADECTKLCGDLADDIDGCFKCNFLTKCK